jgi:hypothetical protein
MIPPENYRIAIIYNPLPQFLGYGGYMERGLRKICKVKHFVPGEEEPGFDEYWYVDDGPSGYMEPRYHPATFFAIDMVVKPFWYLQPVETYFQRLLNFDRACVSSTATLHYCQERGLDAKLIGFAADLEYHRPLDFPKDRDWVAVWHNCGDRVAACDAAYKRFPGGQVTWAGNDLYAAYINRGKCALNWLRGDIVNMRVFEVMACQTPLITTRHKDMAYYEFEEGKHYLGFNGIDEMLDKIGWVLEHRVPAEQMALKARTLVAKKHTYYHRALSVFI